jgi:hypothetical protein
MRIVVLALMLVLVGCSKPYVDPYVLPPAPIPPEDGGDAPLAKMCAHLREVRCSEGFPKTRNGKTRTCYQAMVLASDYAPIPIVCVVGAKNQEETRACGDPSREITFRCVPSG